MREAASHCGGSSEEALFLTPDQGVEIVSAKQR
jgi:hypothetical protein